MAVNEDEPLVLTRDEIVEMIDSAARERRGISARTLLRSYRRGQLDDPGGVMDLLILADLLPEDDPIVAEPPRRSRARR